MERRVSPNQLSDLLGLWRQPGAVGYRALADRIRLLVIDGRVPVGTRLPSERELAARLDASRTTVAAAFDDLRASGHLETRRGSGSLARLPASETARPGPHGGVLDFATASAAATPFLEAAAARALPRFSASLSGSGYEFTGEPSLREAIARRFTDRGLPTRATQIMVTTGAQSALALVARSLLGRGDRVLVESPGYPHAAEALRLAGARLIPLAVDADSGWDELEAEQLIRRAAPHLVYLIPDFQNPTGRTLPAAARERISAAARDTGATVLIDETTAELSIDRLDSPPPFAAVAGSAARVVTVGSASKTMWGGLRVGWIRASEETIANFAAARPSTDLGTAIFDQLVAAELFSDFEAVLEHRRDEHRSARDALLAAVARELPAWRVPHIDGGLSAWVRFDASVSSQLALGARTRGLRIAAGPWFGIDGAFERFIRIPFGPGADAIEQAVHILADVWQDVADAPRTIEPPLAAVV